MPGEHDQAIGLQRLESPKDSVSRLETFESLEKVICAWISTNSSRKDTMGVDDYDCVLGKNLGQQKGNPERFSVNKFLQPKTKKGSLIAINSSLSIYLEAKKSLKTISSHFLDGGSMVYLRFSWSFPTFPNEAKTHRRFPMIVLKLLDFHPLNLPPDGGGLLPSAAFFDHIFEPFSSVKNPP